jgi:hypothetical protein
MLKKLVGGALCAVAVVGLGSSAFAGEITGSGKGGPAGDGVPGGIGTARSACVYSGLEDGAATPGVVQNWGHVEDDPFFAEILDSKGASWVLVRIPVGPGGSLVTVEIGCNPHTGAGEG